MGIYHIQQIEQSILCIYSSNFAANFRNYPALLLVSY